MLDLVLTMTSITMTLLALMKSVNAFTVELIVIVMGMSLCDVLKLLYWGCGGWEESGVVMCGLFE